MNYTYTVGPNAVIALLLLLGATACGNDSSTTPSTAVSIIMSSVEPDAESPTTAADGAPSPATPTSTSPEPATSTTATSPARPTVPIDTVVPIGETGERLHIRCVGAGPTTVLLISGFTDGGDSWGAVEPAISEHARVCSYARFGTGTSDAPPRVQTFETQADDLAELLATVEEPGPYVVVGHSFGGPLAVTLAARFPDDVRGLLLLDATPVEWPTAVCSVPNDGTQAAATYNGLCSSISDPALNVERLDAPRAFSEAGTIADLGDIPIIVAAAAERPRPGLDPSAAAELQRAWDDGQAHWTSLSTKGRFLSVQNSGHYIQTDQPAVVIEQILDLLDTAGS